jgi:hypothetical protein
MDFSFEQADSSNTRRVMTIDADLYLDVEDKNVDIVANLQHYVIPA